MNNEQPKGLISEDELRRMSAYAPSAKPAKGKAPRADQRGKNTQSKTTRELSQLRERNASLVAREQSRKENTPTVAINTDSIDLVYTGKVAGKTTSRFVPIVKDENVALLKPLLVPVVTILNAAVRERQIEETVMKDDQGHKAMAPSADGSNNLETVYHATALTRGQVAYEQLFQNPRFISKLRELADVIADIQNSPDYQDPGRVQSVSRAPGQVTGLDKLRQINPDLASRYEAQMAQYDKAERSSQPKLPGE